MNFRQMLLDWFTESDGKTFDVVRLLYVLGVLSYIGMSIWSLFRGQHWEPEQYGYGFAATLVGGGAAIGIRAHLERPPA